MAALESQFRQRLLVRSKSGVVPTDAGRALYRHAQLILRQVEQAQSDVSRSGNSLSGKVSIGLAPYSTGAVLALPLLQLVRKRHPDIVLHINENFGGVISELVMTGRMDLGLIYDPGPTRGVVFAPMFVEELFLVTSADTEVVGATADTAPLKAIQSLDLMLPSRIHTIRKVVDTSFERLRITPKIIAEIESVATLGSALSAGLGATILPWSSANRIAAGGGLALRRVISPAIEVKISLCTPDHLPMSEAALAVRYLMFELIETSSELSEIRGVKRIERRTASV